MKRHKIGAVALAAALLCAPCLSVSAAIMARAIPQSQDTPPDVEQAMFSRGQKLYNDGRYEQAASVLNDFLKTYPNSIITDLTLLWLGRAYIALGRIKDAEQVGDRLRSIKDTPFIEIYDDELGAARKELAARGPVAPQRGRPPAAAPSPDPRMSAGLCRDRSNVKATERARSAGAARARAVPHGRLPLAAAVRHARCDPLPRLRLQARSPAIRPYRRC